MRSAPCTDAIAHPDRGEVSENAPLMDRTSAAELDGVHSNAGWSWRGRLLRRKVVRAGRVVVQVERGEAGRQLEKAERQGWGGGGGARGEGRGARRRPTDGHTEARRGQGRTWLRVHWACFLGGCWTKGDRRAENADERRSEGGEVELTRDRAGAAKGEAEELLVVVRGCYWWGLPAATCAVSSEPRQAALAARAGCRRRRWAKTRVGARAAGGKVNLLLGGGGGGSLRLALLGEGHELQSSRWRVESCSPGSRATSRLDELSSFPSTPPPRPTVAPSIPRAGRQLPLEPGDGRVSRERDQRPPPPSSSRTSERATFATCLPLAPSGHLRYHLACSRCRARGLVCDRARAPVRCQVLQPVPLCDRGASRKGRLARGDLQPRLPVHASAAGAHSCD